MSYSHNYPHTPISKTPHGHRLRSSSSTLRRVHQTDLPSPRKAAFGSSASLLKETVPRTVGQYNYSHYPPHSRRADPYYQQKLIVTTVMNYLTHAYGASIQPEHAFASQHPKLPYFVFQLLIITNLDFSVISATIVILQRLRSCLSDSKQVRPYRLFLGAFILAARENRKYDKSSSVHADAYWARVSKFPVEDIKAMRRQIKKRLHGDVFVYAGFESFLEKLGSNTVAEVIRLDAGGLRAPFALGCETSSFCSVDSKVEVEVKKSSITRIFFKKRTFGVW